MATQPAESMKQFYKNNSYWFCNKNICFALRHVVFIYYWFTEHMCMSSIKVTCKYVMG